MCPRRSYLADVAHRHGTPCFKDVKDAVQQVGLTTIAVLPSASSCLELTADSLRPRCVVQVIDIAKGRLSVPKTASKDNNESL